MPTIEEREIVMGFDHRQFDNGVEDTLSTLDKLKNALDFKGASKSLENLQNASNKFNLNGVTDVVYGIQNSFSAMEIAGMAAINRLVNQGMNAAERLVKSLSVDQISAGWSKYGQKTEAVQTIMSATAKQFSSTAEQMEVVNAELDKLSWFTDETSYKFLDMVQNIGKFTSNGVKLETAVTAMQGISTWAALSGAGTNEAARAMYNLSQAMGSGKVELRDWMSIENANMATEEFKEIVLETAAAEKILTKTTNGYVTADKKAIITTANFRENLKKGFFTSEVLLKSLNKYGKASELLRDFSEATELSAMGAIKAVNQYKEGTLDINELARETGLSVAELSKHLKVLASDEHELGLRAFVAANETKTLKESIEYVQESVSSGWMRTFELIFGDYTHAKKLWSNLSEELYEIFVAGGDRRNALLKAWNQAGGYDILWQGVSNLWNGLKNLARPISEAWNLIFPPLTATKLLDWTKSFEKWTEGFAHAFDWAGDLRESLPKPVQEMIDKLFPKKEIEDKGSQAVKAVKEVDSEFEKAVQSYMKTKKQLSKLAEDTVRGKYGNNPDRFKRQRAEGLMAELIQNEVNRKYYGYKKDLYAIDPKVVEEGNRRLAMSEKELAKETEKSAKTIKESSETIEKSFKEAKDPVQARVENLFKTFSGLYSLLDLVYTTIKEIGSMGLDVAGYIVKKLSPLGDSLLELGGEFGEFLTTLNFKVKLDGSIGKYFEGLGDKIKGAIDVAGISLDSFWVTLTETPGFDRFIKSIDTLLQTIHKIATEGSTTLGNLFSGIDFDKLGEDIGKFFGHIAGFGLDKVGLAIDFLSSFAGAISDVAKILSSSEEYEKFKKSFSLLIDDIVLDLSDFFTKLDGLSMNVDFSKVSGGIVDVLTAVGKFSLGKAADAINSLSGLSDAISNFWNLIKNSEEFENFKIKFNEFIDFISGVAETGFTNFKGWIGSEEFANTTTGIGNFLKEVGKFSIDKLGDLIGFITGLASAIGDLWDRLKDTESFQNFKTTFSEFIDFIGQTLQEGIGSLVGFTAGLAEGIDTDGFTDTLLTLGTVALDKITTGMQWVLTHKDEVKGFFGIFTEKLATAIEKISVAFEHLGRATSKFGEEGFGKMYEFFGDFLTTMWDFIKDSKSVSTKFIWGIDETFNAISTTIGNIDFTKALEIFSSGSFSLLIISLSSFISRFTKFFTGWGRVGEGIYDVLFATSKVIKAYVKVVNAQALIKIAQAISILAIALIGLTYVDSDNLDHAAAAMVSVIMAIALVIHTMGKLSISGAVEGFKSFGEALAGWATQIARHIGLGIALLGFAALVVAIIYAMKELIALKKDIWTAVQGLAIVFVAIVAGLSAVYFVAEKLGPKQDKLEGAIAIAAPMIALAITILAIAKALQMLTKFKWEDLWPAMVALSGVLLAFGAAGYLMKDVGGIQMLAAAGCFIVFAAALSLLLPTLLAMQFMDIGTLIASAVVIGALAWAFKEVITALKGKTKEGLVMVAIAASLYVLAKALAAFGTVGENWQTVIGGVIVLAGAIIILAAAFKLLEWMNVDIIDFTVNLALFGIAALTVSAALYVFGKALPEIVNGLIALGQGIKEHGKEMLLALIALLVLVLTAFTAKAVIDKLNTGLDKLLKIAHLTAFKGIIKICSLVLAAIGILRAFMPDLVDGLFELLIDTFNALSEAIKKHGQPLAQAIGNLFAQILLLLVHAVVELFKSLWEVCTTLWDEFINSKLFGWISDITQKAEKNRQLLTWHGNEELNHTSGEKGSNASGKWGEEYKNNKEDVAAINEKSEERKAAIENTGAAEAAMQKKQAEGAMAAAAEGTEKGGFDYETAIREQFSDMPPGVQDEMIDVWKNFGIDTTDAYTESQTAELAESKDDIADAASGVMSDAANTVKEPVNASGHRVGSYYIAGIGQGIKDGTGPVLEQVRESCTAISNTASGTLKEASPSKVGIEIGRFFDKGIEIGIRDGTKGAVTQTAIMANSVINGLKTTADLVNSFFDEGINSNPVISPVLDLQNLQNGMSNVDGLFSSTSYALSGSMGNIESSSSAFGRRLDEVLENRLGRFVDRFETANENRTYEFTLSTELDGRQIARSTATYTNEELERLNRRTKRKAGIV